MNHLFGTFVRAVVSAFGFIRMHFLSEYECVSKINQIMYSKPVDNEYSR